MALSIALAQEAAAGSLDRIRQDKTLRIAYREDAPPFSYKNNIGEPAGFMVDLCRAVAKKLTQQLQLPALSVIYVPVTAANRFEAIQQSKADLLCEPTSATLSRRELVDFSISTYIDGASLMIRADGPRDLQGMSGHKIGVLGGTTTEQALRNTLKGAGVTADIVLTKTHAEGLGLLDNGTIAAYFADRDILTSLVTQSKEQAFRKQRALTTIHTLNEAPHQIPQQVTLESYRGNHMKKGVFTQPGSFATGATQRQVQPCPL
jgi:ABC-type amino acid transport substrate-binding protein